VENAVIITGARVALSSQESSSLNIHVHGGRIARLTARDKVRSNEEISLEGFLVLPGLINAHDHLEFSLFPRLGRKTYPNATAWAQDIYRPADSPIREHLAVPKSVRLFWGGIKNLINGVTSVCHHNPYYADVFDWRFPVRVIKRFGWAHSISFCTDFVDRFKTTPSHWPFIIHAAEGTDETARDEIRRLDETKVLAPNTLLVHGVAIRPPEIPMLARRGSSLVWCPTSNLFMLGRTISGELLTTNVPIALGTDSALTAQGDLIDEIRVARRYVGIQRIYDMLTSQGAGMLRLSRGEGTVREGGLADLLIVRDHHQTPGETLMDLQPELVLIGGRVKLISLPLADRLRLPNTWFLHRIAVKGRGEWLIDCDVPRLKTPVGQALGTSFDLARQKVA
jgi:cytosine/adenosine deaminase-related metal-dependent hydrolase